MPALRTLNLDSYIWNERQYLAVSGTHPTPSVGQLPQTALRTLSSVVSQILPSGIRDGAPDGSSSSNSHRRQLENLELWLTVVDFEEMSSSGWENIGWDEFIKVMEALAGVGRMSLELEREALEMDPRPLEEWETMLDTTRSFVPRPGATSVMVFLSVQGANDKYMANLLREKLRRLQEKGVGVTTFLPS